MDGVKFTAYGRFVPTERIITRHLISSIVLVMALLLLGMPRSFGASPSKAARPVFQKAHAQTLVIRSAESKSTSRKAPEKFATGLDDVDCETSTEVTSAGLGWLLPEKEIGLGVAEVCGFHGRAPPSFAA